MDLLVGCKVSFEESGVKKIGIIVKTDGEHDGSYCWMLMDDGNIRILKTRFITVSEDDIVFINELSDNRIERLKMMKREIPTSREELIDLD